MALGSIPPWISVNPRDFLLATQAGAQMGHAVADATQRAWEEQERMKMAAEQRKTENAAQRLAAERLEQYRQSEIANRQAELGIQRQGLGLRGEGLGIQRQREEDRQAQRDFMNEFRQKQAEATQADRERGLDLRERGLDRERPATTKLTADQFGPELSGPIDSPEVVKRLKQRSDALEAQKNAPGIFQRAKEAIFGSPAHSTGSIPLTPTATSLSSTNEVIRVTGNGRKAVFDANTKKFLRYAD